MNADIPSSFTGQITPAAGSHNVITKVPAGTSGLAEGGLLNAVVLRHDASGNPVLGTQSGELTIASKLALQNGASLVLRILTLRTAVAPPAGGQAKTGQVKESAFRAQIVSVNGKAPELPAQQPQSGQAGQTTTPTKQEGYDIVRAVTPFTGQASTGATEGAKAQAQGKSQVSQASSQSDASIIKISNGARTEAVVITPSSDSPKFLPRIPAVSTESYGASGAPQQQNTSPAPPLKASDSVVLHIISSNIHSAPNTGEAEQSHITSPNRSSPYQGVQSEAQTISSKENNVPLKEYGTPKTQAASGSAGNKAAAVTQNTSFTGTVIGTEKSGEAVIKTPLGTLKLPAGINLPQGSILTLEVVKVLNQETRIIPQLTDAGAKSEAAKIQLLGSGSALNELATTLAAFDAEIGGGLIKAFPAADKQSAAKILWFLSNVQSGSVAKWLGPELHSMLEQYNKKELISRLERAFTSLRAMFSEVNSSGWQNLLFPVYDGGKLQYGQFYIHRDGKKKNKGESDDDIRFVVELYLDMMGEFQIDGLVKTKGSSKKVDLFIRTKDKLPDDMRKDIIDIFLESAQIQGIGGEVQFQVVSGFSRPYMESEEESHDGGIIA